MECERRIICTTDFQSMNEMTILAVTEEARRLEKEGEGDITRSSCRVSLSPI